jgi:5-methylcytosine-specific restriction endonuclease McrA
MTPRRRTERRPEAEAYRALYKTARWKRRRAAQLRGHPLCAICEAQGRVTPATVAHHVTPHRGDPAPFWNGELQSLCKVHHDVDAQSAEKGGSRKHVERGPDGCPLDW